MSPSNPLKTKLSLTSNYINATNVSIFFKVLVGCSFINHKKLKWFNVKSTWLCKWRIEDYILQLRTPSLFTNFQCDTNSKLHSFCWVYIFNAYKSRDHKSLKFPFLNKISMLRSFFKQGWAIHRIEVMTIFFKSRTLKKRGPDDNM